MKILVIEDTTIHQEAARKKLADHELTVMESFTEFFLAVGAQFKVKPTIDLSSFDAVLTDVILPSPTDKGADFQIEMGATGFLVAMKALEAGVKFIGVITDANHHMDIYGKGIDMFGGHHSKPFRVGKSLVCITDRWLNAGEAKEWDLLLESLSTGEGLFETYQRRMTKRS